MSEIKESKGSQQLPNYLIRLQGLDKARSRRMYQALSKLSTEAVEALKIKNMKQFSILSDKMRQLLSYISTNSITLSDHFKKGTLEQTLELDLEKKELSKVVTNLKQNLKVIENACMAASAFPFKPLMFASEEITYAYLDYVLPLAWDFDFDLVILINLNDPVLLDHIVSRGQKRFLLVGGNISEDVLNEWQKKDGLFFLYYENTSEMKNLVKSIDGRPPAKIISMDCGEEKIDQDTANKMKEEVELGRTACWHRFNTINRADARGILDNLHNLTAFSQASELHEKFIGCPAVIVCPGPSLKKNVALLKKVKGRALIICVLHALVYLQKEDIHPDFVIHVDPVDLKTINDKRGEVETSLWEKWILENDLSKVNCFITGAYANPRMFSLPTKNTIWMNPGLPIGEYIPIGIQDYTRVGGSVAHSAFDIAVNFGCSSIALVGQDLAYGEKGLAYAPGGLNRKKGDENMKGHGRDIEVEGFYGKPITTNEIFLSWSEYFSSFAEKLQSSDIRLFNCTEGGMYIEGFQHCTLQSFLEKECTLFIGDKVDALLSASSNGEFRGKERLDKVVTFVGKNLRLSQQIKSILKKIKPILKKKIKTDLDLRRFDKLQNKVIKLMGNNYFYSLILQTNIHILQSGLKADDSVKGQLGFHQDFLEVVEDVNYGFGESLLNQKKIFKKNNIKIS